VKTASRIGAVAVLLLGAIAGEVRAQEDFGARMGVRRGGVVGYDPVGPGVLFDPLDPAVKKWYVPQELFNEYQWRQQEYTNYARRHYQRYVNISQEGDFFYDMYGNYITRGELVYDWTVAGPQTAGSSLFKTDRFGSWFSSLAIASDRKGQYSYALTIGDRIRSTLTPMTFSKPSFAGMQFDLATDKYEATLLVSRPSSPGQVETSLTTSTGRFRSNDTNLLGGRGTIQIGDFVKLGATYVNAFNASTKGQAFEGNPFKGTLTEGQNSSDITRIEVRLSDDSPEDNEAGAAFFQEEMIITTIDGQRVSNRRRIGDSSILNFSPSIQGGFRQEGFLAADGSEVIALIYDLEGPQYINSFGPRPEQIKNIEFLLLLANDYRIDVTSNRQLNANGQPVLLSEGIPERTVRADGNVKDGSNQGFVRVNYGLPVANEIFGITLDVTDLGGGFFLSGEWDRNRRHFRYPRRAQNDVTRHESHSTTADAWFVNVYKRGYPYFGFGEVYNVDPSYSTSSFLAGTLNDAADINYDDPTRFVYEFIDDNDDQDRNPDWLRANFSQDLRVFPGYDENNDFISDFNQNDFELRRNSVPDYEEPFLRYNSDRPEFLFGIDMNNNRIIDRFENDNLPDYLYKRDRRGYNVYVGSHLGPEARLTVGRLDERQLADDRENVTNYALLTYDLDVAGLGRFQVYNNYRIVQDDIRDDVIEWIVRQGTPGVFVPYTDPLPLRDAWANTLYLGYQYRGDRLQFINRFKWEIVKQNDYDDRPLDQQDIRETASLFGVVNKIDYTYDLGVLKLQPRWKSEFLRQRPTVREDSQVRSATTELRELLSVLVRVPILSRTELQTGVEYLLVNQYRKNLEDNALRGDRNEIVGALQFTNNADYLGYNLWTQVGMRVTRIDRDAVDDVLTETTMFATVFAGLD
jgi:hypothetical protein